MLDEALAETLPDLMRSLLQSMIIAPLPADVYAVVGEHRAQVALGRLTPVEYELIMKPAATQAA